MLARDTLLQNRYRIISRIGQGGMGAVYQATDERLDNTVAVKQVLDSGEELHQAFEREARLLANLRHPALPKVIDHFVEEAGHFLVMEFVPGQDLAQMLVQRPEPFGLKQVLDWADQLLNALVYLHSQQPPIIHRDIKPHNLKLMANGEIILLDFGLAKGFPGQGATTSMAGYTLVYASPEQIREEGTDARSDLYSLAATLYDLMTGVKPPNAVNRITAEVNGKLDPLQPAHEVNAAVPVSISLALLKAMALDREQRFASAREMRQALGATERAETAIIGTPSSVPTAPGPGSAPPNNLPAQLTPLIGRENEIDAVAQSLRRNDVRLMTLTGPGGVGKTRMVLAVAAALLEEFANGVFFVSLAPVHDPNLVLSTIARTLGAKETGKNTLWQSLLDHLREKQVLLLLDNFEQVITAAPQVTDLLVACPRLKILVTSREVLHLRGEYEFPVPSLTLPDPRHTVSLEALSQYEAVELFIQRALAVRSDFAVTDENAPAVAEICFRLDGLPLAIELAAARVKLFSPQAMLQRLGERFKLLQGGARDLPVRQQTLRATLDWSYDLLNADEQMLFRRLGVFVGGCTFGAIEAVCDVEEDALSPLKLDVLEGLASLIDKSLLLQREGEEDDPYYSMLETLREYAHRRLNESGELAILRQYHLRYYLELAEQAESELRGPDQISWGKRLDIAHDNLRLALRWAEESRQVKMALRLSGALWRFWWVRGHLTEGRRWLEVALAASDKEDTVLREKALTGAGTLARDQADYAEANAFYEENLAIQRAIGDQVGIARALNNLGTVAIYQEAYKHAIAFFEESLALRRESSDRIGTAGTLNNLGLCLFYEGDYARAEALFEEGLKLYREVGDYWGTALALSNQALIAFKTENFKQSQALFEESLHLFRDTGDKEGVATVLSGLAWIAGRRNNFQRATCLSGASVAILESMGTAMHDLDRKEYEHTVRQAQLSLGKDKFAAAWDRGQAMSLDEVIKYALGEKWGNELR